MNSQANESTSRAEELEKWLEGRPQIIKDLAHKYPPGTIIAIEGDFHWVISYNEDGSIYVTSVNPFENYDEALAARELLCADCLP